MVKIVLSFRFRTAVAFFCPTPAKKIRIRSKKVYFRKCKMYFEPLEQGLDHRISTARMVKGGGRHFFHQIKPIWPLPFCTMPVPRLRDARPAGWVTWLQYMREYNVETQNRAGIGSIILWRRFTLPIFLLFIYGLDDGCNRDEGGGGGSRIRPPHPRPSHVYYYKSSVVCGFVIFLL